MLLAKSKNQGETPGALKFRGRESVSFPVGSGGPDTLAVSMAVIST